MRFGQGLLGALVAAGAGLTVTQANADADPRGIWFNDTGRGAIEIKSCGENLCGEVVWVKDASDSDGCGKKIIGDVKPSGAKSWDGGWIYSPEKKKTYDVELTPIGATQLRVIGYAGTKLFSKTMIWTRAPDNLIRCKAEEVAAAEPAAPALKPSVTSEAPAAKSEPAPQLEAKAEPEKQPKIDRNTDVAELSKELGDVFTRDGDRCKLDLPWVKLNFTCDGK